MLKVKVIDKTAAEVMDIVRELRQQGLVQGHDFDFEYHQSYWDYSNTEAVRNKHAIFTFYVEKYATLFSLKYV